MGTRRRQKISDAAICALYRGGASRYEVCIRAGLYDRELLAVLRINGVPLRSDAEARALAAASRRRHLATLTIPPKVPA